MRWCSIYHSVSQPSPGSGLPLLLSDRTSLSTSLTFPPLSEVQSSVSCHLIYCSSIQGLDIIKLQFHGLFIWKGVYWGELLQKPQLWLAAILWHRPFKEADNHNNAFCRDDAYVNLKQESSSDTAAFMQRQLLGNIPTLYPLGNIKIHSNNGIWTLFLHHEVGRYIVLSVLCYQGSLILFSSLPFSHHFSDLLESTQEVKELTKTRLLSLIIQLWSTVS